jgi:hypothetical protein
MSEVKEPKKKVLVVEEVEAEENRVEDKSDEQSLVNDAGESNTETEQPLIQESEEKPNYLWIIVPTALLVGALAGGLITYFSAVPGFNASPTSTPIATIEPLSTETPVSSPSAELKKESLKIQILNGSGVSGVAGKAKTYLENLGYKNIEIGNANSSSFETTEISIKTASKEYLDLLLEDLGKDYEVSTDTKILSASSKFDAIITLGKK